VLLNLQFMVILDVSVVNVALPDVARDLSLSGAELTWVLRSAIHTGRFAEAPR
jgi:hypothetical protein